MSKVAVVGATGKTGSAIVKQLHDSGYDVTGIVRNPSNALALDQYSKEKIKFQTLPFETTTVSKYALFLKDFDSVIFAAGIPNLENHQDIIQVELDGALKIIEASEEAGVKRLIYISSIGASDRDFWSKNELARPYYIVKRTIDKFLERSSLDYTIIEPGPLVDEKETGLIKIPKEAYMSAYEDFDFETNYYALKIDRRDVVKAIQLSLENGYSTIRKTLPLVQGDTPIEEVVKNL